MIPLNAADEMALGAHDIQAQQEGLQDVLVKVGHDPFMDQLDIVLPRIVRAKVLAV